jgi:hypothetical protein
MNDENATKRSDDLAGSVPALAARFEAVDRAMADAPLQSFSIGICDFECRSEEEAAFRLVENFLPHPGYDWPGRRIRHRLCCRRSPDICAEAGAVLGRLKPELAIENFEGDPKIACWDIAGWRVWSLEVERTRPPFVIVQKANSITVIVSDPKSLTQMMRALREIYLRESEKAGAVLMHGGGFVRHGESTIVVADKSQGKTTMVLLNLLSGKAEYLANDRVVVLADARHAVALPFPMAVRVGWGTMKALPQLQLHAGNLRELYRSQDDRLQAAFQDASGEATKFGAGIKVEFTPWEIARIFGVGHSGGAPIVRVIVPAISQKAGGVSVRQLAYDEAIEVLRGQCMTPRDEKWIAPWLVPRDVDLRNVEATLATLALSATILRVEFGFDDIGEGAGELVELLHDAFRRARIEQPSPALASRYRTERS